MEVLEGDASVLPQPVAAVFSLDVVGGKAPLLHDISPGVRCDWLGGCRRAEERGKEERKRGEERRGEERGGERDAIMDDEPWRQMLARSSWKR
jgi:hypothetical protein